MKTIISFFQNLIAFSTSVLQFFSISFLLFAFGVSFVFSSCTPTFEEKQNMALSLTIPGGPVQLSGNPIWVQVATDRTGVTNQYIMVRITCTDGSIPNGPWIEKVKGTSANIDIRSDIDYVFEYLFNADSEWMFNAHDLLAANITVEVGEQYVYYDEVQTVWSGEPEEMVIIKGKLTDNELGTLAANGSSFYDYYIDADRFLTNRLNQTEQNFYVSDISHNVKVWIYRFAEAFGSSNEFTLYFSDGTSVTQSFSLPAFETSKLYEVNLEVEALYLADLNPGKTVVKYKAQLGGDSCYVHISNKYEENHTELLILNRLGAIEVLHCYGELSEDFSTEKETVTRQPPLTPSVYTPTKTTKLTGRSEKYKINTGFKTLQERLWIKDLLESQQAWMKSDRLLHLTDKGFGIAPVIISAGTFNIDTTSEDLKSIDLEIQIAH